MKVTRASRRDKGVGVAALGSLLPRFESEAPRFRPQEPSSLSCTGFKDRCTSRAVSGAPVLSLPTTHLRVVTKVDSSSGWEVAASQWLAELVTGEKNRCILVTAPAGDLVGD
jgi:hypothetical protein